VAGAEGSAHGLADKRKEFKGGRPLGRPPFVRPPDPQVGLAYSDAVNVSELGEFGLIERLADKWGQPSSVIVGIGDDAAAWRVGTLTVLATTDTLVEGVHFQRELIRWRDVGWKAMAANVSDIAAMGGTPQYALVTLSLPPETEVEAVDELQAGMQDCASEYDVAVVGGDIVRAPQVSVTVALIGRGGEDERGNPALLRRDAAGAGDSIAVTGTLGDSAAGLVRLREGASAEDTLVQRHLRPQPRIAEGQAAAQFGVKCAIDVSDGLAQDVGHVCEASGLGAVLRAEAVPVSRELREAYPGRWAELACTGGEDYELALVAPQEVLRLLKASLDTSLVVVGEMVEEGEGRVRVLDGAGKEMRLPRGGWDHLKA
jgi:thiamine-monophosphate kinase